MSTRLNEDVDGNGLELWTRGPGAQVVQLLILSAEDGRAGYKATPDQARRLAALLTAAADSIDKKRPRP